jgi:hypothetical protein
MQFTPKTDAELDSQFNIPEGSYTCSIKNIYDTERNGQPLMTKKGAPKWNVSFRVETADGERYLSSTITPAFAKLHKHFCVAFGFLEQYMQGQLNKDDFIKTMCKAIVVVGIEERTVIDGADKNGNLIDKIISKSVALDFLPLEANVVTGIDSIKQESKSDDFFNDSLLF